MPNIFDLGVIITILLALLQTTGLIDLTVWQLLSPTIFGAIVVICAQVIFKIVIFLIRKI